MSLELKWVLGQNKFKSKWTSSQNKFRVKMGFLSNHVWVLKWVSSLLVIYFNTLIRSYMCKMHHFWILALLHCHKYHISITMWAYRLHVLKLRVFNSYLGGTLPIPANIFILKDIMLCLHTQIHTHTHTYKHITWTCTNVSLV
jgi:hypothetical protein